MIEKCLEMVFRHKKLLLLPPVLLPLILAPIAWLSASVYYDTWAGVWADRPAYLSYNDDTNRYLTPAQTQSALLTEWLHTRTFLVDIAKRTSLASLVGTPREDRLQSVIGANVTMYPTGSHLLVLRFRADTPDVSLQVMKALMDAFKEKASTERVNQAGIATSFYEARLQAAEQQLAKSNEAMRRYVAANPRLTTIDPSRGAGATTASRLGLPAAAIDPELGELLRRVESDQSDVERARTALDKAQLDISASLEGQQLGFQVVDPPETPRASRDLRKRLILPVGGLILGIGLSAILLVLLLASDRAVRSENDLAGTIRVVGVVPRLQVKKQPRRASLDSARRAIGFVAGTALPAPPGAS
jgi:hypothetical protein